jgi:branched-chain amino acid transport system substrate-binding protein
MRKSTFIAAAIMPALASTCAARAQEKISDGVVKIGLIEDMSSLYADITGIGAVTAAKMAVEDFGGKVLGKPIEVVAADHQNTADISSTTAQAWFDTQHVDALLDVAASATALAAIEVAKSKNKIVIINGAAASRITNEACTRVSIHYSYDTYAVSQRTGAAMVKAGYDTWFFLTADYPSATTWSRMRRPRSKRAVARYAAAFGCRSTLWISLRLCCKRRPRKRR